jgi:heterodisulfide reductase subunit C
MNQTPETVIDLDRSDWEFAALVARTPGGSNVALCYACGACSARCPVEKAEPDFDPRRFIRLVVLGQKEQVLQDPMIWHCSTCFTCQETCPEGVGFTEVMFALKNLAAAAGHHPPGLKAQVELLKEHGRLYEIGEFENQKRAELGLPEIPERPEHFQVLLDRFEPAGGGE